MNKKQYVLLLVAALVFWTAAVSEVFAKTAFHEERQRETLHGLRGVGVLVEDMNPDTERDGLTRSQLQTDVELRLRKASIRVLTLDEMRAAPGNPFLYVNVDTFLRDGSLYAFAITVALEQAVALKRISTTETIAATWFSDPYVGTVGKDNLQEIRKDVADGVDAFINAYLAVNPR